MRDLGLKRLSGASLVAQMVKNLPSMQKTCVQSLGSVPGLGIYPGEGNGNPLQQSCLKSPVDRGACWATIHGVSKSWTQLSDFFFFFTQLTPFKHSNILFRLSTFTATICHHHFSEPFLVLVQITENPNNQNLFLIHYFFGGKLI